MFWDNFWPNFASTISGLVLGLPFALWANRLIQSTEEKKKEIANKARLRKSLDVLIKTLSSNSQLISKNVEVIGDNRIEFELHIDTSAWDIIQSNVVELLLDPILLQRVSYHFERLKSYKQLHSVYFDFAKGLSGTLTRSPETRSIIKEQLLQSGSFLIVDANELNELLR